MEMLAHMNQYGHEELCVYSDPGANLQAFIAIHDTSLGPALGGIRMWQHPTEEDALMDVLRLSRAMTYKSAVAGLPFGGGKALIMADPRKDSTEALFRSFGRFVETIGGRYIATEDVGVTVQRLEWVALETEHVVGLSKSRGGSGDPSTVTGFGVYQGMKACAKTVWGNDSLAGRTIAMQGFGKVANALAHYLLNEEKANLIITDINEDSLANASEHASVSVVAPEDIYEVECDIFAPCALGGVLNSNTIPRLKCALVCGGANNQLLEEKDAQRLQQRGILYAPDYVVNAGGVINLSIELAGPYVREEAMEKTAHIYDTMERVVHMAKKDAITTAQAADHLAEQRIASMQKTRLL